MFKRSGRHFVAIRGLTTLLVVAFALVAAAWIWHIGATSAALRERAYPIPSTECEKAKDCDERALKIQAREAITADAVMDITLGQLALSILGIGGVGIGIFYARLAWREAQRSASAAERALEASARAFVFVDSYNLTMIDGGAMFSVVWRNCGTTPAVNAINRTSWQSLFPDKRDDFAFDDINPDEPTVRFYIGPGAIHHSQQLFIDTKTLDLVASRIVKAYVWGWIVYTDTVLGVCRQTEFCALLDIKNMGNSMTETGDIATNVIVGFPTFTHNNAIDDGCAKLASERS